MFAELRFPPPMRQEGNNDNDLCGATKSSFCHVVFLLRSASIHEQEKSQNFSTIVEVTLRSNI